MKNSQNVKLRKVLLAIFLIGTIFLMSCAEETNNSESDSTNNENIADSVNDNLENNEADSNDKSDLETNANSNSKNGEMAYEVTYKNAKAYTNSIGTIWVQAIFEITNTGEKPLYLSSGAYDLEDKDGKLIESRKMVSVYPDVIDPGEKAYYYEETTIDKLDSIIELNIIPRPDVKQAKIEKIRFPITDFELSDGAYKGIDMLGRVENTSGEPQNMIYIVAILYDSNSIPIGQIFTIIMEELAPGDKIGFSGSSFSLPSDVSKEKVASYEVYAYPLQYQF